MGLSQSLYTGWTGLTTHQRSMDNTGNNLANVNTVGYKKSDYMFSTIFSGYVSSAVGAGDNHSSINAIATGMGVSTGAIMNNFKQGPIETTGNSLDLAINGNGFFMVGTASGGVALTRNGSFYLDHTVNANERLLCAGDGLPVQGWMSVNGSITPSTTVGNIYLPAIGDVLPGSATTAVSLRGILPTNTSSSDFSGSQTTALDLKGNLSGDGQSLTTTMYVDVTQTGGSASSSQTEAVNVRIDFSGPTLSADGSTNTYTWTMTTVDWPNVGDPGVQIYPASGDPGFTQGAISFYAESSPSQERAAGQAITGTVSPGSSKVTSQTVDADGATVTTTFTVPADFSLDVSRLTNLADAPGGNELETWYVNGCPEGSMSRSFTVYDEYTEFVQTTDAAGNTIMEAIRSVQARENTIVYTRTGQDDAGNYWSWENIADGSSGTLSFNTQGDLVESTQTGGSYTVDFSETRNINSEGSMQVLDQDGYPDGSLKEITIDQNGKIWGHYSNDVAEPLAQIALATVPNPYGLDGGSGTLFYLSAASGELMIGVAGDQDGSLGLPAIGAGYLTSGALEGSNVDLSQEFTNLISIERGYQFNSKVVTTSDELLQTALGMKR